MLPIPLQMPAASDSRTIPRSPYPRQLDAHGSAPHRV